MIEMVKGITQNDYGKILAKMKDLEHDRDIEMAHIRADELLVEVLNKLGYTELTDAWNNVGKWYA